jgi:large subunit ribosomal protein L6
MSRIGKKPIDIPAKVEIKKNGLNITVKGPKGELAMDHHPDIAVKIEDNQILVERPTDLRHHRSLHGLTRSLIANMVTGVSDGFVKVLEIEGVGYQADLQGRNLNLRLGFSHPVVIEPPEGVSFEVPKESRGRVVQVAGIDKQVVGQVAADIRKLRPPEPYKGKGVRYSGERIIRKAGKAGKS